MEISSYTERQRPVAESLSHTELAPAIPLAIKLELFGQGNASRIAVLLLEIHGKETRQRAPDRKDVFG